VVKNDHNLTTSPPHHSSSRSTHTWRKRKTEI
jgi:hypothetical protein